MKCEICNISYSKYTCPACLIKTCSVVCCSEHKKIKNCTGVRDKTKFVKIQDFKEPELLSDYRFLEEQSRLVDSTKRDNLKRRYDITSSMDYLKKLAYRQYSINLKFMPRHSSKRLANKTRFDNSTNIINWFLEFSFHNIKEKKFQLKNLCSCKSVLKNILTEYYAHNECELFLKGQLLNEYDFLFKNIEKNQSELDKLEVLFEQTDYHQKKKYFVRLDIDKTLEENLFGKTIIEFPTLFILKTKDLICYNIETISAILKNEKEEGECDEFDELHDSEIEKSKKQKIDDSCFDFSSDKNFEESGIIIEKF